MSRQYAVNDQVVFGREIMAGSPGCSVADAAAAIGHHLAQVASSVVFPFRGTWPSAQSRPRWQPSPRVRPT